MKIELTKQIDIYKMEFIGEVDFFRKSPYIELLENIESENQLRAELESRGMPESAIKNVIKRLYDLRVLQNGYIENLENGFPEKEYGKFELEIFENDESYPFVFKNRKIQRQSSYPNKVGNLEQDVDFLYIAQNKGNLTFRVEDIEKDKAIYDKTGSTKMTIVFQNNKWQFSIDGKTENMDEITFEQLFGSEWDLEYLSLKVSFEHIHNDSAKNSFEFSFDLENFSIKNYGTFQANFTDIPVIPKTEEDANLWAVSLLKDEVESKNRYISKYDLEQLWNNILDTKTKLTKFDIEFNYQRILNQFGRDSKYYWLLQASNDLAI